MSRRWILTALAVCVVLAAGCARPKAPALHVGVVDTAKIVEDLPEYRDLNIDWVNEQNDFLSQLPDDPRSLTDDQKKALSQQAQEKTTKFDGVVKKFFEDAFDRIQSASAEVAQQKDLDLVVIDTPYYPTINYHSGENITTDILLKLRAD